MDGTEGLAILDGLVDAATSRHAIQAGPYDRKRCCAARSCSVPSSLWIVFSAPLTSLRHLARACPPAVEWLRWRAIPPFGLRHNTSRERCFPQEQRSLLPDRGMCAFFIAWRTTTSEPSPSAGATRPRPFRSCLSLWHGLPLGLSPHPRLAPRHCLPRPPRSCRSISCHQRLEPVRYASG